MEQVQILGGKGPKKYHSILQHPSILLLVMLHFHSYFLLQKYTHKENEILQSQIGICKYEVSKKSALVL